MSAVINTGLLEHGLKSDFFARFDSTKTHWQDLVTVIPSNSDQETFKWLGTLPLMREWGQGRKARGVRTESYSVENLKYEATMEVDRDELSDDKTGQIKIRVNELAARAATHKDYLASELLKNGATSGFNSYDGVTFFNAAHESGESGSQSNVMTPDAADADDPTVPEFKVALKAAIAQMLGCKDDQGHPMSISATGLVCVVPPTMYLTALEAVSATVISSTSNVLEGAAGIVPFAWLDDASKWYLLKVDVPVRGLILQDREPIEFGSREQDSDQGFMREKYLYGVRARYRMTYGYWQHAISVDFTEAA